MNVLIAVLFVFAVLGAIDKIFNYRKAIGYEFDKGILMMGQLAVSMTGIYCYSIVASDASIPFIEKITKYLPFDPSILIGSILSSDIGAYAASLQICGESKIASFSGLLLASMLGSTISFALPAAVGSIKKEDTISLMTGTVYGLITIPVGLFVGGLIIGLPIKVLVLNTLPILLLCSLLCFAMFYHKSKAVKLVSFFGTFMRIVGIILFMLTVFDLFWGNKLLISMKLIEEIMVLVLRVTVIICGSLVLVSILLRKCKSLISKISTFCGINEFSVMGILMTTVTSLAMFPIYDRMDNKGKIINAAFAVSGAFVFGGQLAFVSSSNESVVAAYVMSKLISGAAAIILAAVLQKFPEKKNKAID